MNMDTWNFDTRIKKSDKFQKSEKKNEKTKPDNLLK